MLDFNSRATYLVAVADWKAMYADHSQLIRDTRRAFKLAQAAYSKEASMATWNEVERLCGVMAHLRDEATSMIDQRHRAKEEAQRQYLQARAEVPAAA